MDSRALNHTVATAIRVEHEPDTDRVLVVFEITDEKFKQRIKQDWTQDIEFTIVGKSLKENV